MVPQLSPLLLDEAIVVVKGAGQRAARVGKPAVITANRSRRTKRSKSAPR